MSLFHDTVYPVSIEVIQLEKSVVMIQPHFRQENNFRGGGVRTTLAQNDQ